MSTLLPDASPAADGATTSDSTCRVKHVVSTGAVFAAALDRLNRASTLSLIQALASEVEEHRQKLISLQRERRRFAWLPFLLLLLLLGGGLFGLGVLNGRRSVPVASPPAPACCAQSAVPLAASASASASMPGHDHGGAAEEEATAAAVRATAARASSAAASAGKGASGLKIAGLELQPNTMEAELLEFLMRPGSRAPHLFTMDRLRYPAVSHEVNPEGKEQIYLIAKILLAHPRVHIEIRGHNDGTESELYTGPNPRPPYTLSQLRADCVLRRLAGLKVPGSRMRLRGMASTQPIADDRTQEGRQLNRRVEIVVLSR